MAAPQDSEQFASDVSHALQSQLELSDVDFRLLKHSLACPPLSTTVRLNSAVSLDGGQSNALERLKSTGVETISQDAICRDVYHLRWPAPSTAPRPAAKQVVVGHLCAMSVLRGSDVYAPAIKGIQSGIAADELVAVYGDIHDTCSRGLPTVFSGEKVFVGNGIIQMSRKAFFQQELPVSGLMVRMTERVYSGQSLRDLEPELLLQNLPSCVAVHVLCPRPGERVLDMCAAPGGKTSHMANLMEGQGELIALERSKTRAASLSAWLSKVGCDWVDVHAMDACKCVVGSKGKNMKFEPQSFDRVLLDAPCSGLGQRPRFFYPTPASEQDLEQFASYQRKLLQIASQLVKPGGCIVYSTCSISVWENEDNVAWALSHLALELVDAKPRAGGYGRGTALDEGQRRLVQRFLPPSQDTIGFFIAKFRKI